MASGQVGDRVVLARRVERPLLHLAHHAARCRRAVAVEVRGDPGREQQHRQRERRDRDPEPEPAAHVQEVAEQQRLPWLGRAYLSQA